MKFENTELAKLGVEKELASAVMARRRVLLGGVGKGAAILAATVPLQTLAGQSLLTHDRLHQCSISGMHSGVHSATPTNTPTCVGYSPAHWADPSSVWPTLPGGGTKNNTKFNTIFTWMQLGGNPSLFQVEKDYGTTTQGHWLCAWLNALMSEQQSGLNYPYTATEVIAFSKLIGTPYSNALQFFTQFMETKA